MYEISIAVLKNQEARIKTYHLSNRNEVIDHQLRISELEENAVNTEQQLADISKAITVLETLNALQVPALGAAS